MKNKKKKKNIHKRINYKELFINSVKNNKNDLWLPKHNRKLNDSNLSSWFSIKESNKRKNKDKFKLGSIKYDRYEGGNIKCKQINLNLTNKQKKIIDNWLDHYLIMYNRALKLIKKKVSENKIDKYTPNFYSLRKELYDDKSDISKSSQINNIKVNTKIKVHDLDYAIKLACSNYKSALTRFKKNQINHFRIRYWRMNKKVKIMDLEKNNFSSEGIRKKVLGSILGTYNGEDYDFSDVAKDCRLGYNEDTEKYILFVPEKIEIQKAKNKKGSDVISLDPGLRTFLTGLSENKVVKIGDNSHGRLKKILKKIDGINNNDKISQSDKRKHEKRHNKKIINLIDDLHWKSIDYLTKNYKNILIGNMSSKRIINNESSNLSKIMKRIALKYKFYQFRSRLHYKCNSKGLRYKCVNESYTSKVCSECGYFDKDLGKKKVYECKECKIKIDRDVNGCRNIYMKAVYQ